MIVLLALLVLMVALPATIVVVALTIAGSAVAAVAEGSVHKPEPDQAPSALQPSPGPASGI